MELHTHSPGRFSVVPAPQRYAVSAMALFTSFGGMINGYETSGISGIVRMSDWLKTFGKPAPDDGGLAVRFSLSTGLESLVLSASVPGTIFGAVLFSLLADKFGRKIAILAAYVIFLLGIGLQTGSTQLATFILGRFFAGVAVGALSTVTPIYQAECSPRHIRGAIISSYHWAFTLGILVASVVNNSTKDRDDHSAWRIPISLQLVWALVLFVGTLWLPESPRWLVGQGRYDDAAKSLSELTALEENHLVVQDELTAIVDTWNGEKMNTVKYADCFRASPDRVRVAFRTWTSIAIAAFEKLTGLTFIILYGTSFSATVGVKNPFLVNVVIDTVQVVATVPGVWAVDRIGRRPLLIFGAIAMSIFTYLIAILSVTSPAGDVETQRAIVALICLYIASYSLSWGPLRWLIPNEINQSSVRAKAMSLSSVVSSAISWAIVFASPYLMNAGDGAGLGPKIFFIWGTTTAVSAVFVFFCVPETKGLSLEQIDIVYRDYHIPAFQRSHPAGRTSAQERSPTVPSEPCLDRASLASHTEKHAPV